MKLHSIVAFYGPKLVKGFCLPVLTWGSSKSGEIFSPKKEGYTRNGYTFYGMFKQNCER
jgi:hypothetical protein